MPKPMMMVELDKHIDTLRGEIREASDKLLTMTSDTAATMESIREAKTALDGLRERLSIMEEQKAAMAGNIGSLGNPAPAMTKKEAAGMFYRAVLNGQDVNQLPKMLYEQLGAIPAGNADQGSGSVFLPTQLSNDLLMEPSIVNPLRPYMTVTQITGLELPKMLFQLEDDSFLAKDGETAKELKITGENVRFGRNKMHLIARVSETVLRSSPLNIEAAVTGGLTSAQAAKELSVLFAAAPKTGEEDMSFYAKNTGKTAYLIKEVKGKDLLASILASIADLEDGYRDNARVVMRFADYVTILRALGGDASLYSAQPEQIIGKPVIFCDRATIPVVGDISYMHLNFDSVPWVDTDKDVEKGNRLFTSTTLYDIKPRMRAAFRLATIQA